MAAKESAGTIGRRGIPSVPLAVIAGCMLAGAIYTFSAGDDVNWDWRNYHAYNVWATINHRYDVDVIPAGFQTYFNPLIYYPVYVLRQLLSPWPVDRPSNWVELVNRPLTAREIERVQLSIARSRPLGSEAWISRIARSPGLTAHPSAGAKTEADGKR